MRSQAFLDQHGNLQRARQLPPLPLLEFLDWLQVIELRLRQQEKPLETLYLSDRLFQQVCDRCLELHGLQPDSYTPDLIVQLVSSDLPQLNRMEPGAEGKGEAVTVQEWVYSLIAALIEREGMRGAIVVAETVPCDLLDGVLQARAKQLKTDKKPSLDDPEMQDLIKELDADLFMPVPT